MGKPQRGSTLLLVGTSKGAFLFHGDRRRKNRSCEGPFFPGLAVHHFVLDPRDSETLYAAASSEWWGCDIQRSRDWGRTWQRTKGGVRYERSSSLSVKCVWHIRPGLASEPNVIYAGVDPAGLFRSEDGGVSWEEMKGLNGRATRKRWFPGKGGLILHTILLDPHRPGRMFVAVSAAGVFCSDDSGRTWQPRNRGTRADFLPQQVSRIGSVCPQTGSGTRPARAALSTEPL